MKRSLVWIQRFGLAGLLSLALSACTVVTPALHQSEDLPHRLKVVATYSVLGDLVRQVADDRIKLTVLVDADGDPHVYEPTPRDAIALAEADILFENGLEFENWLDDLYAASASQAIRVAVSDGIDLLLFGDDGHDHEVHNDEVHDHEAHSHEAHSHEAHSHEAHSHEAHSHEVDAGQPTVDSHGHDTLGAQNGGHTHGEFDPHIWLSPRNAIVMVENIRKALAAADPGNAEFYTANAAAYVEKLEQLDAEIRTLVAEIPKERRKLVTTHEVFGYFARDYGFEVLGSALGAVTSEAADPGAGQIAALVEEIRAAGVPAIFVEAVGNPSLMARIAEEAGVKLAPPLYTHGLGPVGSGAEDYIGMIRTNVKIIVDALR